MNAVIEKWEEILQTVKSEYEVTDVPFNTWLKPLKVYEVDGNLITVAVPSEQAGIGVNYITKRYKIPLQVTICVLTDLEEKIREMFFSGEIDFNDEVYITNERHRQELLKAQESLSLVENSIESGMPEDFYSIDLTDAYESLGRILGESLGEDLVNEIFSKFCMGK